MTTPENAWIGNHISDLRYYLRNRRIEAEYELARIGNEMLPEADVQTRRLAELEQLNYMLDDIAEYIAAVEYMNAQLSLPPIVVSTHHIDGGDAVNDDWRYGFAAGLAAGALLATAAWWLWLITTRLAAG